MSLSPGPGGTALARVAELAPGCPLLAGNALHLLPGADAAFPVLLADLDSAARLLSPLL